MFGLAADAANVMPSRYRQVTTAAVDSLDPDDLCRYFTGREAYRRTRFVVARLGDQQALVEVARTDDEALFSDTVGARVLAPREECVWVRDPTLDCGIASHLAAAAARHPGARCVIVEGQYEHISFLLNPQPIEIEVLDIVPPTKSKLVDQVRRVLDFAEALPPIILQPRLIDSRDLLAAERPDARAVLVPCRGGGVDVAGVDVSFLDERPPHKQWTMLGCQRSQQIHRSFYGEAAEVQVDFCPRRFLPSAGGPARITRCCLRESGLEHVGATVIVPWGASLEEVRLGVEAAADAQGMVWTPI